MAFCSFEKNAGMYDSTPIENMFLLEYLPTASGDFLRVYLYMRMLCLHPEMGSGLEEVARVLGMEADAVFNALTYWERVGLVRRLTDRPPTYEFLPVLKGLSNPMEEDYYEFRDFNANLQALFGAENLLHPQQYEMASDWVTILGFSQEAVLRMVESRLKRSRAKKPDAARLFSRLNETAAEWSSRGIRTLEDVEQALLTDGQVEKTAGKIMKQLSMHRTATVDELKLVAKWMNQWGLSESDILDACAETTKSRTPTLAYLDSVLENRRQGEDALFDALKAVFRELGAGGTPTPAQIRDYRKLLDSGYEPETVLFAAAQCARKNKHRFEDLEWMLDRWGRSGIRTRAQAEAYVQRMNHSREEVQALLLRCGSDRQPQMNEITAYERLRESCPQPLIEYAADCAKGMHMPLRYMEKLLTEWAAAGIQTVDAARAERQAFQARHAAAGKPAANPALQYQQREPAPAGFNDLLSELNDPDRKGGDPA